MTKNKNKSIFKTRYRIVNDNYCGYEVQKKLWWFPFWVQCGITNIHSSVEKARNYIKNINNSVVEYYEPNKNN